jgi:GNAT superfamily N-acetyltransferase
MTRKWQLSWRMPWLPRKSEIQVDPSVTTFVARYASNPKASSTFRELSRHLEKESLECKTEAWKDKEEYDFVRLIGSARGSTKVIAGFDGQTIMLRCMDPNLLRRLRKIMDELSDADDDQALEQFVGEVWHAKQRLTIEDHGIKGVRWSGVSKKSDNLLFNLFTYYEFRVGPRLVAKALLSYRNGEMMEYGPTIELVEVTEHHKSKGIGTAVVREIEDTAMAMGFDRIWVTDAGPSSVGFWEKMGYDVDFDECFKYLA